MLSKVNLPTSSLTSLPLTSEAVLTLTVISELTAGVATASTRVVAIVTSELSEPTGGGATAAGVEAAPDFFVFASAAVFFEAVFFDDFDGTALKEKISILLKYLM